MSTDCYCSNIGSIYSMYNWTSIPLYFRAKVAPHQHQTQKMGEKRNRRRKYAEKKKGKKETLIRLTPLLWWLLHDFERKLRFQLFPYNSYAVQTVERARELFFSFSKFIFL